MKFVFFVILIFSFNFFSHADESSEKVLVESEKIENSKKSNEEKINAELVSTELNSDKEKKSDSIIKKENFNEEKKSGNSEIPDEKKIIPEIKNLIDSSKFLHLNSFKDENLELLLLNQKNTNGGKTLTLYSKDKLQRLFYDNDFYLSYVEKWSIGKTVEDSKLEKIIFYKNVNEENFNKNQNENSNEKNLEKLNLNPRTKNSNQIFSKEILEYDLTKKNLIQSFYDKNNLLLEKIKFSFLEDLKFDIKTFLFDDFKNQKNRVEVFYIFNYDNLNRIIFEEENSYIYKTEKSTKIQQVKKRKNVFKYESYFRPGENFSNALPTVIDYFEDDVLRIKTIYRTADNFAQNIYFENNAVIKSRYINGKKISEEFILGSEEIN